MKLFARLEYMENNEIGEMFVNEVNTEAHVK